MTPEETEFFRDMEQLFLTPGWARLAKGWKDEAEALPAISFFSAKDMADTESMRVRYSLLQELLTLPATLEARKQELLKPKQEGYE